MNDKNKPKKERKGKQVGAAAPLPCLQALEAGNYFAAHKLSRQALQNESSKQQATEVLARISVDKVPLLVFAACLVLVSIIAFINLG